jgi:hypothetical protein
MNEFRDHIARVLTFLPRSRSATTRRVPFVGLSLWYEPVAEPTRTNSCVPHATPRTHPATPNAVPATRRTTMTSLDQQPPRPARRRVPHSAPQIRRRQLDRVVWARSCWDVPRHLLHQVTYTANPWPNSEWVNPPSYAEAASHGDDVSGRWREPSLTRFHDPGYASTKLDLESHILGETGVCCFP